MSLLGKQCSLLLTKIKNTGEAKAEDQLLTLAWNHLLSVARHYLYNKNDAEDVVQNSFLRAFQYINTFQEHQDGYNWLCKIVQREAYNFNASNPPTLSLDATYLPSSQEYFSERVVNSTVISQYLAPYGEVDKEILQLHFFDNLSFQEIADKLGMKKSNVHKRATKIMREILKKSKKKVDE